MKSKFTLTESERNRILGLHKSAIKKEFLIEQTQYIKDAAGKVSILQGPQVVPQGSTAITQQEYETALKTQNPPANQPVAAPTTATPTTPTTATTPQSPTSETKVLNDRDYTYKKEGDKYFFKLQTNPGSDVAKKFKTANKYVNWTEATGKGLDAIKKLNWGQSELMPIKSASSMKVQSPLSNTTLATGTNPTTATPTTPTTATPTTPTTATPTTPTTATPTTPTTATATTPEIAADLKTASEIRQQFRQGRRDQRQIQRQYDKMTNTYNRLAAKMDKNTKDQYIAAMNALKQQLGQA